MSTVSPLYPQEPTSSVRPAPSEKCQLRTYRRNQSSVVCGGAVGRANIPLGSNGAAPMPLTKQDARHLRPLALPLILVVASWAASVHAQGAAGAGSNASEAVPGPVFSGTGPDAAAYGADAGFPVGTRATASERGNLVGTYSHFDELFPSRSVGRSSAPWQFKRAPEPTIFYNFRSDRLSIDDYLSHNPTTLLLIVKDDTILYEHYRYARTDRDRFLSQSMAKTITAMLIGIVISENKIRSTDDTFSSYVRNLPNTEYCQTSIQDLL